MTTVASYGGFHPSRIRDEHVVGMPRVHMLSFSATGTPASGPGSSPATTVASTAAAASRASSTSTRLKAWIVLVAAGDGGEVLLEHVDGAALAGAHRRGDLRIALALMLSRAR